MKTVKVASAIIQEGNKIFAAKRGHGKFDGLWEFPGGKLEDGETSEEAVVREVEEELKATVTIKRLIETVEYDYPDFHLTMDCFLCSAAQQSFVLTEHKEAKWFKKQDLDTVDWMPANAGLIETLKKLL